MRLLFTLLFIPFAVSAATQETWESGYADADVKGPQVLGCWKFDGELALKDLSGHGNDLLLQGAKSGAAGKFGNALESFPGFPIQDKRHAAVSGPKPALSPKGSFTLEMWIRPKADWAPSQRAYLLDKKYVDHNDYAWQVTEADKAGARRFFVTLGFGGESKVIHSEPVKLEAAWQHVAFVYDGEGEGMFFLNGSRIGGMKMTGYGAITPGTKALSIGDRLGSNYGGFPGYIDEVRICEGALKFERASLVIQSSRNVWRRMETGAKPLEIVCTNLRREKVVGARLRVSCAGKDEEFILPDIKPGGRHTATHLPDTTLNNPEAGALHAEGAV